ncbi:MAG: TonB family protein [Opitutales bacterium]|nr:TonB family protein [Opitutales bacterium]
MRYFTPLRLISVCALLFMGSVNVQADSGFSDEEVAESADMKALDTPPKPKKQSAPVIPPELHGMKASVQVGFIIDEKGRVVKPRIVQSSNDSFNEISLRCIRSWEFEPGKKGGEPVKVRVVVPLRYK